jgi:lantibiotic modifying enzyme
MVINRRQLYQQWTDIFSKSSKRTTVQSELRRKQRFWLSRLMTAPYLPQLTAWALIRLSPRSTHILGRRAAKLLGKNNLPEAYWQRLLILGNLPSDVTKIASPPLLQTADELQSKKYWLLFGLGWLNYYKTTTVFSGDIEEAKIIVAPLLNHIRKGLKEAEKTIFDQFYADFQDDACLRLRDVYQSLFKKEISLRALKSSILKGNPIAPKGFVSSDIIDITRNHRGLVAAINIWSRNCELGYGVLCHRIARDSQCIKEKFKVDIKDLNSVRLGYGDRHISSQSTSMLLFDCGFKLFYKPRSLALEEAFSALALKGCQSCDVPEFNLIPPSLDCGDWSYQEFVESDVTCEPEQINDLVSRLALITVLLDICGATDCHDENLLVTGDTPLLIDGETLFHEAGKPTSMLENENSILVTGFCHLLPPNIAVLLHSISSQEINPVDLYLSELRRIYYHQSLTSSVVGELKKIKKLKLRRRLVFRSTSTYSKVLRHTLTPSILNSSRQQASIHEDLFSICLASGKINRSRVLLCESESLQLENGWIPYFDTQIGESTTHLYDHYKLRSGLHRQVIKNAKQRLRFRQAGDADRQIKIIYSILKLFPKREAPKSAITAQSTADELLDLAIFSKTWKWLFFHFNEARDRLEFTYPTSLYEGALGITVFLGLCRKNGLVTHNLAKCREIEKQIRLDNESFFLNSNKRGFSPSHNLGFNGGVGGKFLSLLLFSDDAETNPEFVDSTLITLGSIVSAIENKDINQFGGLDIMSGLAGLAGGVHAWSTHQGIPPQHPTLLRFWNRVSRLLIDGQKSCGGWDVFETPVSGFAHGASGMICALAISELYTKHNGVKAAIGKAIQFQLNNLSERGEWLNLELTRLEQAEIPARSWCSGSAGALVAAAVIKKAGLDDIKGYEAWLNHAREATLNHTPVRDQICCGIPGWLMAMAAAGRSLNDEILIKASKNRLKQWIEEVENGKDLYLRDLKSHQLSPPGLFVGKAGVGLSLLPGDKAARVRDTLISCGYLIDNNC